MRTILTLLAAALTASAARGQRLNPDDYIYPVRDVPGLYSANFGELRPGHFHAGIDIKTDGVEGKALVAVADGHVSRVVLQPGGYGRAVYLTLDNGVTAVRSRPHTYAVVREAEGRYRLARGDEAVEVGRRGYFVAEVSDRRNDVQNTFGVWRVQAAIDGEPYFEYRMNGFTHDLSRCCDAVSCYPVQVASRNEAIRLARLDRSPELFYPILRERGLVRAAAGERHRIRIEAEDDCGNISALEFEIEGRDGEFRAEADPQGPALRPDRTATMRIGNSARMTVPEGALYEPIHARPEIRQAPAAPKGVRVFSPAYHFLDPSTPLRSAVTVSVNADIPRALQLRTVLALRNRRGALVYAGGHCTNGVVTASTRTAGDLVVVADTLAPVVRARFERGADLSRARSLQFHAGDNFSGIAGWRLEIDGEWVPCDRFPMRGTLVHRFDRPASHGRHTVRLTVTDACGNTARLETEFVR